jgi:hypothetical protein
MQVTEVTAFHRVSAFMFFNVIKRPPTHYVTTLAKLGSWGKFALPALPLLLELP